MVQTPSVMKARRSRNASFAASIQPPPLGMRLPHQSNWRWVFLKRRQKRFLEGHFLQKSPLINGGAIIDHHSSVPEHYRVVVFGGTPGGVQGGSVCTHKMSRAGGRHEHPAGGARVRTIAEDHPEDDAVFPAARL